MSKKPADPLHSKAEVQSADTASMQAPTRSAEDLLADLQVHQIELEMQNEQLRQAQLELEKSRDRYVDFYEFSPVGYLTLNHDGMIDEINLTGAIMLAAERNKLLHHRFANHVALEDRERWHRHFQSALAHDTALTCELTLQRSDSSCIYARLDCLRLSKDNHQPVVRIVLADFTERKQTEHALNQSMLKLEKKELAKTRFLAAAGHDLRQPLAAASLFIDTLKLTVLTPQQDAFIRHLDQSMSTFKDLLDALLNISKLDAGVVKPHYTSIAMSELFNWLEQSFTPLTGEKQLDFRLRIPVKKTLAVHSDIGLLKSVLMNLVSNAIKYTTEGTVLVSARQRGREVLLQIWDTGMGIPEECIESIFDEYYQVHNPQRDRTKGLGLGLPIAKRALALLDGEITCRSQVGHGSVFEFRLPLARASSRVAQGASEAAPGNVPKDTIDKLFMQGKRLVVVEDNVLVAQAMESYLKIMGAEVECFNSPEDTLHHADIEHTDFFIIDYMLGNTFNGMQLLDMLRQKSGKPIHAVLVTGDTSTAFIRNAKKCAWPVLHKPIDLPLLISSLREQC